MKIKKAIKYSLVALLVLLGCYFLFLFEAPKLLIISQKLNVEFSWEAVGKRIPREMVGMTKADAHAFLNDLFPSDVKTDGRDSFCGENYGEYVQMGNSLYPFTYIVCYVEDKVSSVRKTDS